MTHGFREGSVEACRDWRPYTRIEGREMATDALGYPLDPAQWTTAIAGLTGRYRHRLFAHGDGPALCKITGMKMPPKVMLDV